MLDVKKHIATKLIPKLRFKEFDGEWRGLKFGKLGELKGGGTPSTDNPEFWQGDIPWISSSDVNEGDVTNLNITRYLTKKAIAESATKIIPKDSVLFVSRVGVGKLAVSKEDLCTSQDFANLIPEKDSSYFIAYYFIARNKLLHQYSQGTSIKGFTNGDLKSIPFSIPTLPEQQKIASFLSAVDKKIQQLTKKKALLEQYKKGVMQQLFSGQIRFKDENGNPYPDWEEKRLGEICSNIAYGMNAAAKVYDGENKYLRITDIDESSNALNSDKFTSPDGLLEDKFRVKEGDILFARTGASVGKSYLYRTSDGVLYFAGFLIRFHVKEGDPSFIYSQSQTSRYDKWVKVMSMRSGQPGINAEEYKTFKIDFPVIEEQQKIATYLSSIDTKIESVNHQITQTYTFKKGLLQRMFV